MDDGLLLKASLADALLSKCVSIDLELDPKTNRLRSFAGVRSDGDPSFTYRRGNVSEALETLDRFAENSEFVVGHNLIAFDAPHLEAIQPGLRLLRKPMIDTLWLNPLAFPRNPYHHLVKHYQDGRLQGGHLSDPELDAKLVLTVLSNQVEALRDIERSTPETTCT